MANAEKRFDIVIATKHQLAKQGLDIVNGGLLNLGKEAASAQSALAGITEFQRIKKDTIAAEAAWKEATAEVAKLGAALKATEKPTKAQQRDFDKAVTSAGKLKEAYQSNQVKLEALRRKMSEAGVSTSDLSGGMSKLKDQLGKITEFRRLEADTAKVEEAWKEAASEADRLATAMKDTYAPTDGQVRKFTDAKAAADKLQQTYQENRAQMEKLRSGFEAAGGSAGVLTTGIDKLKTELNQGSATAKTFGADLAAASRSLDVRPMALVRQEVDKLRADYKALASSGTLSQKELAQAAASLREKTAAARGETTKLEAAQKSLGSSSATLIGQVKGVIAAYVGYHAVVGLLREVGGAISEAETANYNLTASIQAANREFQNTGTLEQWQQKVKDLSAEMRIFSEAEVANAISRTVDMTKRLGLSAGQMEVLIKRTADLSAGKTDLEGGIERVTAALRGEAEASEYLGLTLNENTVKAWYEYNNATGKAWKNLTDLEKAQARFQLFLEQSEPMIGRAERSTMTFSGAIQEVTAQIKNGMAKNKEYGDAMARLAKLLTDNADGIVLMASKIITAIGDLGTSVVGLTEQAGGIDMFVGGLVRVFETLALGVQTSVAILVVAGKAIGAVLASVSLAIEGEFKGAMVALEGAFDDWDKQFLALEASAKRVASEIPKTTEKIKEQQGAAEGAAAAINRVSDATDKASEATANAADVAINAADKQRILDQALSRTESTLDTLRQQVGETADAYYDTLLALEKLTEGQEGYDQALKASQQAQEDYLAAVEALRRAEWEAARQQYQNEEEDLRLSLDRRLQQIQHLYELDVYSRRDANLQKLKAERDFSAAVLAIRQAEMEKAKEIYGEDSQNYIDARRAAQYAELDLKDASEQVTAALVELAKASRRAGDAGEDAGRRGRRGMDEWTDGVRRTREETERLIETEEERERKKKKRAHEELGRGLAAQWDNITETIGGLSTLEEMRKWAQDEKLYTTVTGNPFFASLQRHAQEVYRERMNELSEATRQAGQGSSASDQAGGKTMTLKFQGPNGQTVSGAFDESDAGRVIDLLRQAGMSTL